MCGRFASTLPLEQLARLFAISEPLPNVDSGWIPSWNVAPTQATVVVRRRPDNGARVLSLLSWGLMPSFIDISAKAPQPINARAETVTTNRLFRGAFTSRRCLVPVDAYYEWRTSGGIKTPYAIARADGSPCALGGLWEGHRAPDGTITRSFAIVTVAASTALADLHPRMPLVVEPGDWASWLGETGDDPQRLLRPSPDGMLRAWRISTKVNNTRNDAPDLLAPYNPDPVFRLTPSVGGSAA